MGNTKVGMKSLFGLHPLPPSAPAEEETKTCELINLDLIVPEQIHWGGEPYEPPVEFGQHSKQGACDGTWKLISADAVGIPDPVSIVEIHTPFIPYSKNYDFGIWIGTGMGAFILGFISTPERIIVYGANWYTYSTPETLTVHYGLKSPAGKEFNCSAVIPFVL